MTDTINDAEQITYDVKKTTFDDFYEEIECQTFAKVEDAIAFYNKQNNNDLEYSWGITITNKSAMD